MPKRASRQEELEQAWASRGDVTIGRTTCCMAKVFATDVEEAVDCDGDTIHPCVTGEVGNFNCITEHDGTRSEACRATQVQNRASSPSACVKCFIEILPSDLTVTPVSALDTLQGPMCCDLD